MSAVTAMLPQAFILRGDEALPGVALHHQLLHTVQQFVDGGDIRVSSLGALDLDPDGS